MSQQGTDQQIEESTIGEVNLNYSENVAILSEKEGSNQEVEQIEESKIEENVAVLIEDNIGGQEAKQEIEEVQFAEENLKANLAENTASEPQIEEPTVGEVNLETKYSENVAILNENQEAEQQIEASKTEEENVAASNEQEAEKQIEELKPAEENPNPNAAENTMSEQEAEGQIEESKIGEDSENLAISNEQQIEDNSVLLNQDNTPLEESKIEEAKYSENVECAEDNKGEKEGEDSKIEDDLGNQQIEEPKAENDADAHLAFLHKGLAKGQTFFDSADYQMEKQKSDGINKEPMDVSDPTNPPATDEATGETVPARKSSIVELSKCSFNVS